MVLYTIYRIKKDGRTIYVGSTNNFKRRCKEHKRNYGEDCSFESIYEHDCDTLFARCIEKYFIEHFSCPNNKLKPVSYKNWCLHKKDVYNLITEDDIIRIRFVRTPPY